MIKLIFIYIFIHFLEHKYKFPSSKAHTGYTESYTSALKAVSTVKVMAGEIRMIPRLII